jgi:fibro-slime domain-containing protein
MTRSAVRPGLPWALLWSISGLVACGGGRSSLLRDPDPCAELGHQRSCSNACGEGVQVCKDGAWLPCEVHVATRACSNLCGGGMLACRDGVWGKCEVAVVTEACSTVCGKGKHVCQNGAWTDCDAPQPTLGRISVTLRDFHSTHPDFERPGTGDLSELGLVEPLLGSDDTPTFAHAGGTNTVTGPETFAQWYHDVPGVNVTIPSEMQLVPSPDKPGFYQYGNQDFFPLDDDPRAFGDEGQFHDFDFTLATKFRFHYLGGEVFRFTGDDDLWIYVNRHLAIDLGGPHQSKTGEVYLDDQATELEIERGNVYELHLFFAERHVINSDFFLETTISDPGRCD